MAEKTDFIDRSVLFGYNIFVFLCNHIFVLEQGEGKPSPDVQGRGQEPIKGSESA